MSIDNVRRQAIVTKYYGPTASRGSRIKAKSYGGSVSVAYDYGLNVEQNHDAACATLLDKMEWGGHYIGGGSPDGTGFVYVFAGEE